MAVDHRHSEGTACTLGDEPARVIRPRRIGAKLQEAEHPLAPPNGNV